MFALVANTYKSGIAALWPPFTNLPSTNLHLPIYQFTTSRVQKSQVFTFKLDRDVSHGSFLCPTEYQHAHLVGQPIQAAEASYDYIYIDSRHASVI
jgi:hypothetical protein